MFSVREIDICSSVSSPEDITAKTTDTFGQPVPIKYPCLSHITLARTVNMVGGSE